MAATGNSRRWTPGERKSVPGPVPAEVREAARQAKLDAKAALQAFVWGRARARYGAPPIPALEGGRFLRGLADETGLLEGALAQLLGEWWPWNPNDVAKAAGEANLPPVPAPDPEAEGIWGMSG